MAIERVYNTQVGASATVANALANEDIEFPGPGALQIIGRHEATSTGQILLSAYAGQRKLIENAGMTASDNLGPNRADDIILNWTPIGPGERLVTKLVETTGNATDLEIRFIFEPL